MRHYQTAYKKILQLQLEKVFGRFQSPCEVQPPAYRVPKPTNIPPSNSSKIPFGEVKSSAPKSGRGLSSAVQGYSQSL